MKCINKNGEVAFRSSYGVNVDSFREQLTFNFTHTYVAFEGNWFVRIKGACIDSCVAPVSCGIHLSGCDNAILEKLGDDARTKIFKYVIIFYLFFLVRQLRYSLKMSYLRCCLPSVHTRTVFLLILILPLRRWYNI